MKTELTWVAVSDLERARHFFTKVLKLKETTYSKEYAWAEYEGKEGGGRIGIAHKSTSSPIQPGQNGVITLTVPNIEKAIKELSAANVKLVGELVHVPNVLKMQIFLDEDKNHYQLVELEH